MFLNEKLLLKTSILQWKVTILKWKYPHVIVNGHSSSSVLAPFCICELNMLKIGMDSLAVTPLGPHNPEFARISFRQPVVNLFTSKQSTLCKWNSHRTALRAYCQAIRLAESTVFY